MKYIGVDLAWTYQNETGICVIDHKGRVEFLESKIFTDEEIVEMIHIESKHELMIGIDAPLIVNNEGGSRDAERSLLKSRINGHRVYAFNSNRTFLEKTFKSIRGETVSHLLVDQIPNTSIGQRNYHTIQETFPTGICAGLFPDIYPVNYKRKKGMTFSKSLDRMETLINEIKKFEASRMLSGFSESYQFNRNDISVKHYKHLEDKMDSFLCAFAMYLIDNNYADEHKFGSVEEGCIIIPELKIQL